MITKIVWRTSGCKVGQSDPIVMKLKLNMCHRLYIYIYIYIYQMDCVCQRCHKECSTRTCADDCYNCWKKSKLKSYVRPWFHGLTDWDKFIQHNMTLYRCMISDMHESSYVLFSNNLISNTSLHVGRPLLRPFLVAYAEATLARQKKR